eukprot:scaffold1912_cov135-Cylindrotheca_fusiformis.AAC.20
MADARRGPEAQRGVVFFCETGCPFAGTQLCELVPDLEPTVDNPSQGSPLFKGTLCIRHSWNAVVRSLWSPNGVAFNAPASRVQHSIGACSTRVEKVAFSWYLHYTTQLYPEDLRDSKAPSTHQAFTGYLFHPNQSGWPDSVRNLLAGFDSLDGVTQIPSELVHEFRATVVPIVQDNSYVPVSLTFAAPSIDEQHQLPVPVVHAQTAAPSPAPGPEPAATAPPPPLVTPAGAARGAASLSHQPGSPAIFSICTTSVQQPPMMNPLPATGTNPTPQQPATQPTHHPHPVLTGQGGTFPTTPAPPQVPAPSVVPHQHQPPSMLPTPAIPAPPAPMPGPPPTVGNAPSANSSYPPSQRLLTGASSHQLQNSPPWWAPHHASGGQVGGQSTFQSPQGVSNGPNQFGSGVAQATVASALQASHAVNDEVMNLFDESDGSNRNSNEAKRTQEVLKEGVLKANKHLNDSHEHQRSWFTSETEGELRNIEEYMKFVWTI